MISFSLVIFGVTSNLVKIKLLPAIEDLFAKKLIPSNTQIIGVSRQKFKHPKITHVQGDINDAQIYTKIRQKITNKISIFYLATYPLLYPIIFENMKHSGLSGRLMIEKPFGENLKTAKALDELLFSYFKESNIYRIDHYLGKESVQAILQLKFDPKLLDHIQITSAEDFGVGERVGYYDKMGALKDVGQSHILQMLAFTTAPKDTPRYKLINQLRTNPKDIVFGQYKNYESQNKIDTYFALKTEINNSRFKGVPIFIRAGKNLNKTITEIFVVFKNGNVLTHPILPSNPYEKLLLQVLKGDQSFFNSALEIEAQWKFVDPLIKARKNIYAYTPGSWGPKEADVLISKFGRKWLLTI